MTTIGEARNIVYRHFLAEAPNHPVFDLGANGLDPLATGGRLALAAEEAPEPDDTAMWLRLVIRQTGREQETLGPPGRRRFRNHAFIRLSAFVPIRTPAGPYSVADPAMAAAVAIFSGKRLDGVTTYTSAPIEETIDGPWLPVAVETPMSYDELA